MSDFSIKFSESSKDLTARERIKMKDTSDAIKIDEITEGGKKVTITPAFYAILDVHNERSDNPDYHSYVIMDKNGAKYYTGSEPFWNSFKEIWDEMQGESEEFSIVAFKKDSKNYKGKQFLTCTIE